MVLLRLLLLGLLGAQGQKRDDNRYPIKVNESVIVQEGLCVQVPCSFSYPKDGWDDSTLAHGYWFQETANTNRDAPVATDNPQRKVLKETQDRFLLLGDPKNYNCSLLIKDARKEDRGRYFYRVERGNMMYNYRSKYLSVQVSAQTHSPHIVIPETLESGHPVNLNCSVPWACERGTPPTFSWVSGALSSLGARTPLSSVLTLTPRPQDHGSNVTCQVTLPGVSVSRERTVQLNVTYPPQSVTITVFMGNSSELTVLRNGSELPIQHGQSLRLVCQADSNPPATLNWTWWGLTLSPLLSRSWASGSVELQLAPVSEGGELTCRAQHPMGSQHVSLSLHLQKENSGMTQGALVGAGVTALLFLLLGVIGILMRSRRKGEARPEEGAGNKDTETIYSEAGPRSTGCPVESVELADPPAPAAASPPSEEQEVHYASISFQELKPQGPWEREAPGCEYSEIKFQK